VPHCVCSSLLTLGKLPLDIPIEISLYLAWVGDRATERGGGRSLWRTEIDLCLGRAHPPGKVAVAGRKADLAGTEHTHVAANAWPTAWRPDRSPCIEEDAQRAIRKRTLKGFARCWNNDEAHASGNLPAAGSRRITEVEAVSETQVRKERLPPAAAALSGTGRLALLTSRLLTLATWKD